MSKLMKYLLMALMAVITVACKDDEADVSLNFIGDSLIARWDLPYYFPSRQVYNYGKSGAGIEYLSQYAGRFAGETVVVEIGTNDYWRMTPQNVDDYARLYLETLSRLGAKRIYIYSLLPRDFDGDPDNINSNIVNFNNVIRNKVKGYPQMTYLDVFSDFMLDGKPNPGLFNDHLHLSPAGYELLAAALDKAL